MPPDQPDAPPSPERDQVGGLPGPSIAIFTPSPLYTVMIEAGSDVRPGSAFSRWRAGLLDRTDGQPAERHGSAVRSLGRGDRSLS